MQLWLQASCTLVSHAEMHLVATDLAGNACQSLQRKLLSALRVPPALPGTMHMSSARSPDAVPGLATHHHVLWLG